MNNLTALHVTSDIVIVFLVSDAKGLGVLKATVCGSDQPPKFHRIIHQITPQLSTQRPRAVPPQAAPDTPAPLTRT